MRLEAEVRKRGTNEGLLFYECVWEKGAKQERKVSWAPGGNKHLKEEEPGVSCAKCFYFFWTPSLFNFSLTLKVYWMATSTSKARPCCANKSRVFSSVQRREESWYLFFSTYLNNMWRDISLNCNQWAKSIVSLGGSWGSVELTEES